MTKRDNLGPTANRERDLALLAARAASPNRPRAMQDDPSTMALFAPVMEPRLI